MAARFLRKNISSATIDAAGRSSHTAGSIRRDELMSAAMTADTKIAAGGNAEGTAAMTTTIQDLATAIRIESVRIEATIAGCLIEQNPSKKRLQERLNSTILLQ